MAAAGEAPARRDSGEQACAQVSPSGKRPGVRPACAAAAGVPGGCPGGGSALRPGRPAPLAPRAIRGAAAAMPAVPGGRLVPGQRRGVDASRPQPASGRQREEGTHRQVVATMTCAATSRTRHCEHRPGAGHAGKHPRTGQSPRIPDAPSIALPADRRPHLTSLMYGHGGRATALPSQAGGCAYPGPAAGAYLAAARVTAVRDTIAGYGHRARAGSRRPLPTRTRGRGPSGAPVFSDLHRGPYHSRA